jgi:hypothetical protein
MALESFEYLNPADVVGAGLTPERTNYQDLYDWSDNNAPMAKEEAINKFNPTITGFVEKFSTTEQLTSNKYIWSELEKSAVTYDDAVLNSDLELTRAAGAEVLYRKHEKVMLHTADGVGVFIVLSKDSATQVTLGTYDTASVTLAAGITTDLTAVYCYSLGIEVGMGSLGADFTEGIRQPYRIFSNRPTITREVYSENGSTPPVIKWIKINGQAKWFIHEINETRKRFLESIEKKLIEGVIPDAASDAATTLGLQGTQGVFDAIEERGATWEGQLISVEDLESLVKHYNKVEGAGINLFLCEQDQEFAFDRLGRTFNASYGDISAMDNYIGEYQNGQDGKVLKLGFKGFEHGGYTFLKQGWKYLKENTFRGNDNVHEDAKVHFVAIPVGMTPVTEGDAALATNPRIVQKNYMTKMAARNYDTWTEGGAWVAPRTNGDDKFKVHFLEESMIALFNAEKFIIGKGVAGS